jgi:hypothetical protein
MGRASELATRNGSSWSGELCLGQDQGQGVFWDQGGSTAIGAGRWKSTTPALPAWSTIIKIVLTYKYTQR